jgi:antagonist of KipI
MGVARPLQASVSVVKPGMLTTVQDAGRWGFQARGVPVAGPMDPVSHRLANALVGNDRTAALLEVTLLGPELEFGDERLVAVAGAEFELTVDGRERLACPFPWRPVRVSASAPGAQARARTSLYRAASPCSRSSEAARRT